MHTDRNRTSIDNPKASDATQLDSNNDDLEHTEFVTIENTVEHYIDNDDIGRAHTMLRYQWSIEVLRQKGGFHNLIDIACGSGYGSYVIAKEFPSIEVIGVDYDPQSIKYAESNYSLPNLKYQQGDIIQWDSAIGSDRYDCIISFDTIEHVQHREIMMLNIINHLNKNGLFLLTTPCAQPELILKPEWSCHYIEYNASALYDFLKRYFKHVWRSEDPGFPGIDVFDILKGTKLHPVLKLWPVICQHPVHVDNPYTNFSKESDTESDTISSREDTLPNAFKAWNPINESLADIEKRIHDDIPMEKMAQRSARYLDTFAHLFPWAMPEKGQAIMEIGSGVGHVLEEAFNRYQPSRIIGLDVAPKMVENAKKRLVRDGVDNEQIEFVLYDGITAPLPDNSIDFIYSVACIQHIPKPYAYNLFYEMLRLLKPTGFAAFQLLSFSHLPAHVAGEPFRYEVERQMHNQEGHWHHFYSFDEMFYLLSAGVGAKFIDIFDSDYELYVSFGKDRLRTFFNEHLPGLTHKAWRPT